MLKKLYLLARSLDKRLKFIFVGGLNTLISYCINAAVIFFIFKIPLNLSSQAEGYQVLIASVSGHVAGMVNAYFWNKYFTFQSKEKSFLQVLRFCAVSLSQLAISYFLQILLQKAGMGIYVVQPLTIIITIVFSYIGHNYFTFGNKGGEIKEKAKK